MDKETTRQQKVARQIQKDLAEIIRARGAQRDERENKDRRN